MKTSNIIFLSTMSIILGFCIFLLYLTIEEEKCKIHWQDSDLLQKYNPLTRECLVKVKNIWIPEEIVFSYLGASSNDK